MSALNRSSYWTLPTGIKVRVKRMTTDEINFAIYNIEQTENQDAGNDPYIVQQLCSSLDCQHTYQEPPHGKDGFFYDDWHDLFVNELVKRLQFIQHHINNPKTIIKKPNILVKWFKFW